MLGVVGVVLLTDTGSSTTAAPPAAGGPLAPLGTAATGASVDGIQCNSAEGAVYHIHAHLAIYVNGQQRTIPAGIGIAPPLQEQEGDSGLFVSGGSCFYWLHTHTEDGVIHIEAPVQISLTLGDFFDIWGQPLSATQVGAVKGPLTIYVDGQRQSVDPRTIPLTAHTLIQLDVGGNTPPQPFTFAAGL